MYSFTEFKPVAQDLITALAGANVHQDVGMLLLKDRNINISKEGTITFNYFLDFAEQKDSSMEGFLTEAATQAFHILDINYRDRYQSPQAYPDDLRLFYLKLRNSGFSSFGQMIGMVRSMADKPIEMRGFLWWIQNHFRRTKNFLFRNSMNTFLTILVVVTLIYATYEVGMRIRASRAFEKNVSSYGIEYIGDIYLGDEEYCTCTKKDE